MDEETRRAATGVSAILGLTAIGVAAMVYASEVEAVAVAVVNALLDVVIALKARNAIEDESE